MYAIRNKYPSQKKNIYLVFVYNVYNINLLCFLSFYLNVTEQFSWFYN